jgi:hypothetical protein
MALGAVAQGRGGGRGFGGPPNKYGLLRSKDVQTDLKLSDDQVKKIEDIQAKEGEEMRTQRENMMASGERSDMATMRAAMKKMNDTYAPQFDAVLNSDQKTRLLQLYVQDAKEQSLNDPEVQSKLGLSDDQIAKIKKLNDDHDKANGAIFQKMFSQEMTREDAQPIIQKNDSALKDALAGLLTPDQVTKFKDLQGAPFSGQFQQGFGGGA